MAPLTAAQERMLVHPLDSRNPDPAHELREMGMLARRSPDPLLCALGEKLEELAENLGDKLGERIQDTIEQAVEKREAEIKEEQKTPTWRADTLVNLLQDASEIGGAAMRLRQAVEEAHCLQDLAGRLNPSTLCDLALDVLYCIERLSPKDIEALDLEIPLRKIIARLEKPEEGRDLP